MKRNHLAIPVALTLLVIGIVRSALVAPVPAAVSFPSAQVAFIAGPQETSGSSAISGASWFDQNAIDRGLSLCAAFPSPSTVPGNVLISGTVSVTNGSKIVTGSGTSFLTQASDYAVISNGSGRRITKIVASVQSDTQLTLTTTWDGTTASGRTISSPSASAVDNFQGFQAYYDFAFTQYVNFYRTGDARFQTCARNAADAWYSQPVIDEGKNLVSVTGESLAPRSILLNGLMLRALDGRPEMWPWIKDYVEYQFHLWDEIRVTYPGFYFGVRDGGFMLLYAANLAAAHPDAAVRSDFQSRALNVAKNYYARLQGADGSYTWNDEDFPFSGTGQPFQIGILNEAMIQVHRLTGDPVIRAAIIKSADHEYTKSYNPSGWRAMYYFIEGTIGNPAISCTNGCGAASNPFPPSDTSLVPDARQLNATALHVFGYAFLLTGDAKYKTQGDEIFASTYSGTDGYRGLANFRGKEYNESYRSGGRYLAWRLGSVSPSPSPTPTPSSTPTPSPTATPTPTPTPTPTVTVSGGIAVNFVGLPSVIVHLLRASDRQLLTQTSTDANGLYSLTVDRNSSIVLSPSKAGYAFTPSETLITEITLNQSRSFTATAVPTPTPTPTPDPSPVILPICGPNQRVGSPAVCRCVTKIIGNPSRCKP